MKNQWIQKCEIGVKNLKIPTQIVYGKKSAMKLVILCFVFISLLGANVKSQSVSSQIFTDQRLVEVRADLQTKVETKKVASVAVGVIKDRKIIWKETFGWADREQNIKADSKTIYPLASLSKSITATGLWLLVENGKLSLNDAVESHLKSAKVNYFQGKPDELKIKHLLNMEGGIAHQFEYFYDRDKEETLSLKEQIRRYGFVAFPPGKVHLYSNFSLAVLDQIISDVSGRSFADFMSREVFKPLGMSRTFVERPLNAPVAKGYDSKGNLVPSYIFRPRGGAGMYSTLDDLLQYGLAHSNQKKFLKSETLNLMHRADKEAPNPYYSSGWGVLPTPDGRISLLANGSIAGAATTVLVIPRENLVVVCLTNTTVGNDFTDGVAFNVAGTLLEGYSESLKNFIEKAERLFASKPFTADETLVGEWEGKIKTHQGDFPIRMNFKSNGEILVSLAQEKQETLKKTRLENGLLAAQFRGTIPTAEAMKKIHQISLKLMKTGSKLVGIATAQSDSEMPKFFLPYYVELKKKD